MRLKKWISTFVFVFAMTLLSSPAFAQEQQIVISPSLAGGITLASRSTNVPSAFVIDDNIEQLNLAIDKVNDLINNFQTDSYQDRKKNFLYTS